MAAPVANLTEANSSNGWGRFLRVCLGQILTHVGVAATFHGLTLYAYHADAFERLDSDALVFAIPLIITIPALALVDRYKRKHVILMADTVSAVVAAGLLLGISTTELPWWAPFLAMAVLSLAQVFRSVSFAAAIPELVSRSQLPWANGFALASYGVTMLVGQLAGVLLLYLYDYWALFLADLVGVVLALLLTLVTRFRPALAAAVDDALSWRSLFRWLRAEKSGVVRLLTLGALLSFVLGAYRATDSIIITDTAGFDGDSSITFWSGIVVMAILVIPGLLGRRSQIRVMGTAVLFGGSFLTIAMVAPALIGLIPALVIALAAMYVADAALDTHIHRYVPPMMHGRIFGLRIALLYPAYLFGFSWLAALMVSTFDESHSFASIRESLPHLPYSEPIDPYVKAGTVFGLFVILIGIALLAQPASDAEPVWIRLRPDPSTVNPEIPPLLSQPVLAIGASVPEALSGRAGQISDSLLGGVKVDDGAFDGATSVAEDEAAVDDFQPR